MDNLYYIKRKLSNTIFTIILVLAFVVTLTPFILIFKYIFQKGAYALDLNFFIEMARPVGESGGGMKHAILGTIYIVLMGALMSIPTSLICGIFLSEFPKNKLARLLKFSVEMMLGIPSIVIGIFSYLILVVPMKSFSAIAGAISLSLIMIPIMIKTSEEILKLVPNHLREAGLALGLPRYKVIINIILRGEFTNLITGIILAVGRASGETAPLLFTAFGNQYINYNLSSPMATLPVQIYTYAISPFEDWQRLAWAGAFVLMLIILSMNLMARLLTKRKEFRK